MPTAIYQQKVDDPMAWTGATFTGKDDFAFDLSAKNLEALRSILAATAHKGRDEITPDDARHPGLNDDFEKIYREIMFGRGLAVVRGFPVEEH